MVPAALTIVVKSFLTEGDANDYMAGKDVQGAPSAKKGGERFYGIANGHNPGVYTSWDEAQVQIQDFKGPRYKKFPTREEAEEFVKNKGVIPPKPVVTPSKPPKETAAAGKKAKAPLSATFVAPQANMMDNSMMDDSITNDDLDEILALPSKKVKTGQSYDTIDDLHVEPPESLEVDDGVLKIYTDGSALKNGQQGAIAGVGVYFGPNSPDNVSEGLAGPLQTNQRAELTAILRALEIAPVDKSVTIHTDSKYSIDCVTVWFQNWERNNWMTSLKAPVQNKDLVQDLLKKIRQRDDVGAKTNFKWVKGHGDDTWNIAVDALAVAGAKAALSKRTTL